MINNERKIGAHVSSAGGYGEALKRILAIGGNCLQIFSASPRSFTPAKLSGEEAAVFLAERKSRDKVEPIYFHVSYLINLADSGRIGKLSKMLLTAELKVAEKIKAKGSIVHLGSFKLKESETPSDASFQILINNIKEVLSDTPVSTLFILENAGTRKIGRTLEEIGKIIGAVGDKRLKVCLDTCHLHAAGYDLGSLSKLEKFLRDFDELVGLSRLEAIHANDSKDPFGSLRDRHENIGAGSVGREVFKLLLNHPKTRGLPFICETPGFDGLGPDKKNLDILKALAENGGYTS